MSGIPVVPPGHDAPRKGAVGWLERRLNLTELFSFITHFGLVYTPIDTRRPLREVLHELAVQPMPRYARWPHVLGLMTAILFGLEVVTGVLLAYYFRPTPEGAHDSAMTVVRDVPMGWLVHQMHVWGSMLLVAVIVVRLFRLFWSGLYGAPREVLWMTAIGLGWVALQSEFTGQLLTWDAVTYWRTMRGMEVVFALPLVGPVLAYVLGGRVIDSEVLIRFYVFHVMVLPVAFAALIYLTFGTIRRVGLSPEPSTTVVTTTTFSDHLYSMVILATLLFGLLVTAAVLAPLPFRPTADPYHTPPGAGPPWYMLPSYALIQGLPLPHVLTGGLLVVVAFGVLLLPFWVGRIERRLGAQGVRALGLGALALWVALSAAGVFLERR